MSLQTIFKDSKGRWRDDVLWKIQDFRLQTPDMAPCAKSSMPLVWNMVLGLYTEVLMNWLIVQHIHTLLVENIQILEMYG